MKNQNRIVYYFFLLLDKIRIYVHNRFEKHVKPTDSNRINDFKIFLWQHLLHNLKFNKDGYFFNTAVKNKKSPMVLSQARVILILTSFGKNEIGGIDNNFLIKELTNYLIKMRGNDGLFKFNQVSWNLQDEGIASVWSTLALIKAYEKTNEGNYLNIAISTTEAMLKHLYTKETSLIHTFGDNFWCLNSASTFAYSCCLLLEHYYSEDIVSAMNDSIKLCTEKIDEDGHFPYNLKRQGTYLLLYHPIVILTLEFCLSSKYLRDDVKTDLISANKKAINFLIKQIDNSNRIFEPEIKHYNQYIITNITSIVALKGKINEDIINQMLYNIAKYLKDDTLFLCMDKKNELYNSDLYKVSDVLAIEVLYWLSIFEKI
ncbi:MAG: hypothetical protein KDC88_01065 [Ignavibacteriae bacterium]|nr:hypothetical protein [Ignavibacteriota bacterium]MCB9207953.1 hypothetical protein [Ignavibacteriales bacterium]MCB9258722.1 hypothetical protein [Ignavibacteriales bacterium]